MNNWRKVIYKAVDKLEILGDIMMVAFGAVLIFKFIDIVILGSYGMEPNHYILWAEFIMSILIIVLGINRFIQDIKGSDKLEILGDVMIVAFGVVLIIQFVEIFVLGNYGKTPNYYILWTELILSIPIIVLGINRFIQDARKIKKGNSPDA